MHDANGTTALYPGRAAGPWLPVTVLLFGATLWGLIWWPLKFFHQRGISDPVLILVAYGLVAVLMLPLLLRERRRWWRRRNQFLLLVALGGYANLAFVTALSQGEVIRVMMLFYLAPVWGVIGGRLFLGEVVALRRWFAVAVAVTGALVMLVQPGAVSAAGSAADLLAVTAGMAFALNNVTCRAAQQLSVGVKTAAVFVGCALLSVLLILFQGLALPPLAESSWRWLAVFGVAWVLLATIATQYGVTHMEAGRASVLLLVELLAAVTSALWLGGEAMDAKEIIGGLLIAAAAVLEARNPGAADPSATITPLAGTGTADGSGGAP
ncbi:MAG: DMT family transporter [Gammaproteobacteria bacterium]